MRIRGICPSGPFLLFLVGASLFLLLRETGPHGADQGVAAPWGWVRVRAPEGGATFYCFPGGPVSNGLVRGLVPYLPDRLADGCRAPKVSAGSEIRFGGRGEPGERSCLVVPLPERYRYLMGLPLNVNRAGAEDLELLAGIGPRLAERIVDARDSNGPFSSVRDLLRVPGIGRALVGRIAGRVCFF